ncbi:MAG: DUF4870 domain-containing protein [Planctomycetaceae bacterium]|jgi:uncharacterized Tic20 family protein|nr:DUF4870 domain-containing protein [Planctomycetaceae bacterium]
MIPFGMKSDTYCMLIHLSQLLSFVIPGLGIVVPIVLWAIGKDNEPQIDRHGKIVINWLISCLIYLVICFALTFVLVGFLLFIPLIIIIIVFPVIGGVKANSGIEWKYPLSIAFFK